MGLNVARDIQIPSVDGTNAQSVIVKDKEMKRKHEGDEANYEKPQKHPEEKAHKHKDKERKKDRGEAKEKSKEKGDIKEKHRHKTDQEKKRKKEGHKGRHS